ncbi:hypothetical protein BDZ94DRAFT_1255572 [Collybia nuda]|uniref:DUF6533 domain-containing protein n=1 Tax=Collybia nuda TaxID=64659 RepID=A0A9P5YBQ6_9AGAR|nr:hypothetical protein BDZ94DRAFT_1255572 [Collybia nuda]
MGISEALVRGNRACNYSAMVVMTFTLYDWISTAEEEVLQIWMRPWSNLKSLYIFIRFLSIGAQMVPGVIAFLPSSVDLLAPISNRRCHWIIALQGASNQLLMMAVQIILLLRVEALYQKEKLLQLLLRALYIGEFISMAVMFSLEMPKVQFGLQCVTTQFPINFAIPYFLLPVVVEFIFFVLTMMKFYRAIHDGWARQPLVFRFLQDGIWAFALPLVILTINIICTAALSGPFSSIAFSWTIAIPGFAGCRLILNMSHLLRRHAEGPLTYPPQDFQVDTELLSERHATASNI